jgi:hypothetical protein
MGTPHPNRRSVEPLLQEDALLHAAHAIKPSGTTKKYIKQQIMERIGEPMYFQEVRAASSPDAHATARIWRRIKPLIHALPTSLWDSWRNAVMPAARTQDAIRHQILARISPRPAQQPVYARPLKFVAAFVVVALLATSGPVYWVATPTVAESRVTVSGDVYILSDGLWLPKPPAPSELALTQSALIQTGDNGGKLISRDDFVLRADRKTTFALHDLADRPDEPTYDVTLTLHTGRIWLQSFVPDQVPGIRIAVGTDEVVIHEGSVSLSADGHIQAWNRHAIIRSHGQDIILLAGQEYELHQNGIRVAHAMDSTAYNDAWVKKNLAYDAVHQREIAQIQQERRIAEAGVLPGNPLYPVKRATEAVSLALTFDTESKTKRLFAQANTRLNEAAALLASSDTDSQASILLEEFKDTVVAAASGSDIAQSIIQRELATAKADNAAALPGDDAYLFKTAILETTVAVLPSTEDAVAQELLADRVQAVKRTVQEGNVEEGKAILAELQLSLEEFAETSPEVQEAATALGISAVVFTDGALDIPGSSLPATPNLSTSTIAEQYPAPRPLSDDERMSLVGLILGRWQNVQNPVSVCNEMVLALRQIDAYNKEDKEFLTGRLLRDASSDMAKTFRSIRERMNRDEKVRCSDEFGQPPERVF